jgi:KipI family sensor histidine kinase inhibitor
VRILPYGPRAVLVEFDALEQVLAAAAHLRVLAPAGVREVVPAARTVLVEHDEAFDRSALAGLLAAAPALAAAAGPLVAIDVTYDGADLAEVAGRCGLTADEVVAIHSGAEYTVAFCGFLPGFAYLHGLPAELRLPRRATPRPQVPAGSVAVAGEWASVYPSSSPGGWHLLGTTGAELWDDDRDPPSLLAPGDRVRFVPR